ncbi:MULTISPECIES: hypothetical protein [unclassified Nonomuraea]|uniref:hypothetical protein n=1 Tax=unclassified Nonomuraea TaxID=2593643 RepID=UPI0033F83012
MPVVAGGVTRGSQLAEQVGGPSESSFDALRRDCRQAAGSPPFTLQLWLNADTDVLTTISVTGGTTLIEWDLDGLTTDEAGHAVAAILWAAVTDTASLGLVVEIARHSWLPAAGARHHCCYLEALWSRSG